jgi:hypothetical protein
MTSDQELSPSDTRFDALLRDMQVYGLVEQRTMGGARHWQLSQWARDRLEGLATPLPPPDKLIFIGHRCSTCGERRPTRSIEGAFICDPCAALSPSATGDTGTDGALTDPMATPLESAEVQGTATPA